MAFENVDVGSLRNALTSCKDAINYEITNNIISTITDANVWDSNSKETLKNALENLENSKYQSLKNKLDAYNQIPNCIESYQSLACENDGLRARINELESELSNATDGTYTVVSGDTLGAIASSNGTTVDAIMEINDIENASMIYVGQTINLPGGVDTGSIEAEIVSLQESIDSNLERMNELEAEAYSIL